jgi:hypothetical protein
MFRTALLALACVSLSTVPAVGAPTPMPGGANQVSGVSGNVGDTLFNGIVRLQIVEVRDATPADHPEALSAPADQRVMVMTAVVRNGLHSNFIDLIRYSLADKDDVAYVIADHLIKPNPLNVPQGAAARQTAMFAVERNYAPVKLLVQCATCNAQTRFTAFRVTLPASSVPPAASPAP